MPYADPEKRRANWFKNPLPWDSITNREIWQHGADAAIDALMEAVKDELCRHAYRTGWRDAVEEYHVSGEPPRKGCAADGYQNWLANEPALSAFKGTDKGQTP